MDPFLESLRARLLQKFALAQITIHDFSEEHAGHQHGGLNPHSSATHLEIHIVSEQFAGLNRLQRERLVHAVLGAELQSGRVHALVLKLQSSASESAR